MNEDPINNNDSISRIAYLIAGYVRNILSEKEHDELERWILESDGNMLLFEELTDEANLAANLEWMDRVRTEEMLRRTKENLDFRGGREKRGEKKRIPSKWVLGIAASVLIIIGVFTIIKYSSTEETERPLTAEDVMPGKSAASLTLSDGTVINLNDQPEGLLAGIHGTSVNKTALDEIIYKTDEHNRPKELIYNTLTTPNGGIYKVQLPDGSKVWLNAATTLKYPQVFGTRYRNVELTGEAYFEIVKDAQRPFTISLADSSRVTVLGTEFNVMGYTNEPSKDVTLVSGKVNVSSGASNLELTPGQQVQIKENKLHLLKSVDIDEAIGWKGGEFVFHDADVKTIMRQIERWYDVDIKYEAEITQYFNATIARDVPVSRLLEILEKTDKVHFKIKNKTIYVLP